MMDAPWYMNAVIYAVDIRVFQDSNGDGVGDLPGLTSRLEYLSDLGVSCLWLLPFYPTPYRDNGYDIADYLAVDPQVGTLDDVVALLAHARALGLRVIIDLVMNHTSDQHPWFQAARRDPRSRYRDYYVWSDYPHAVPEEQRTIFPNVEQGVWTRDDLAGEYYYHRFYHFEPELQIVNPKVQDEISRVLDFWLAMGVDGFRIDAASHLIEEKGQIATKVKRHHRVLTDFHKLIAERREDVFLLGESDVEVKDLTGYFGKSDQLTLLFNFLFSQYSFLALARGAADQLRWLLRELPPRPERCQWANFLRNHDELDMERLSHEEQQDVFQAFAPDADMRLYNRGIRRRVAPMLGGDRQKIELALSVLFSFPGAPVLLYGDELGMGEDLSLQERNSVRLPMQWSAEKNGGFSSAKELLRPALERGPFSYKKVNVANQQGDVTSLLNWTKRLIQARKSSPEIGVGESKVLEIDDTHVLAHACEWRDHRIIFVHNFSQEPREVLLDLPGHQELQLERFFGDDRTEATHGEQLHLKMAGYGYQWYRLRPIGNSAKKTGA